MSPDRETKPPSPWDRFLKELDEFLLERVQMHWSRYDLTVELWLDTCFEGNPLEL